MFFNTDSESSEDIFNPLEDKIWDHELNCLFKKCCQKYKRKGKKCKKCPRK